MHKVRLWNNTQREKEKQQETEKQEQREMQRTDMTHIKGVFMGSQAVQKESD